MEWKIIHIDETDSTNRWLRDNGGDADMVVVADYQTAGKGQGTNSWESERGKNLLFSILYHPQDIPANRQFVISMAISLAIADALGEQIGDVSIKWPNDIYWRNGKIGGILIENRLSGQIIRDSIIGVGINVNQQHFHSDAPNPVSLWQIHGQETDREALLHEILDRFSLYIHQEIKERYKAILYRRKGFHPYSDKEGTFMATFVDVEDDGHLLLSDESGKERRYVFKEVQYII
ncbi:MAG: biotin--[acetyl-CoA-carboxylase] ligase [Prevotella sp.]|nr:biotin--[acetyl-CoA-carboxylase] ligase [Prevotella sp.]